MSEDIDPPTMLDECSLPAVARYMQSRDCKRIFVMVGAGISTAAGIPDFRSPETGLYANLARLKLPYPEAVFDIRFFKNNPLPFYTLAHELAPGRYRPTRTHSFIRLLDEKKLLHTCFTQNIDTLERRAGLPSHRIVEAHGSFASQKCIDCKTPFDDDTMKRMIREKTVPKCKRCGGLVKPDIVFFGEALPPKFHESIYNLVTADLLFVIGTSLTVHPFASLTELVPQTCPRVLINLDPVGDIGERSDDVVVLGKCDEVVQRLCQLLHWEEELDGLWEATKDSLDPQEKTTPEVTPDSVDAEVQKLADEVEKSLQIAANLKDEVGKLDKKGEGTPQASSQTVSELEAGRETKNEPQKSTEKEGESYDTEVEKKVQEVRQDKKPEDVERLKEEGGEPGKL